MILLRLPRKLKSLPFCHRLTLRLIRNCLILFTLFQTRSRRVGFGICSVAVPCFGDAVCIIAGSGPFSVHGEAALSEVGWETGGLFGKDAWVFEGDEEPWVGGHVIRV